MTIRVCAHTETPGDPATCSLCQSAEPQVIELGPDMPETFRPHRVPMGIGPWGFRNVPTFFDLGPECAGPKTLLISEASARRAAKACRDSMHLEAAAGDDSAVGFAIGLPNYDE